MIRGWVLVSKVSLEGLYGRVSFQGLSSGPISPGTVDSHRLEGSLAICEGPYYGVIVATLDVASYHNIKSIVYAIPMQ